MKRIILFFVIGIPSFAVSQNKVDKFILLWVNYQNNTIVNNKWSVLTDMQFRTKEITRSWFLFAVRSGVSYKLDDKFRVAAGFCWFGVPVSGAANFKLRNEWRPWQDITMQKKIRQTDLIQRLRLEERFLDISKSGDGSAHELVLRLRYKIDFEKYINKSNWMWRVGNELMINPGFLGSSRFFDQNRTYAAIGYKFSKKLQLNLMLMKIYQWRNAAETLEDQSLIRINFVHQINLKK